MSEMPDQPMPRRLNVFDYERDACQALPPLVHGYYVSGAHDEVTLAENRRAYETLDLRPRVLADVSERDLSATVLGSRLTFPVFVAPMALQRMAHPEGELATARAAAAAGVTMTVSTFSTVTVDEICRHCTSPAPPPWFQLYVFRDRGFTRALVERAESAGCAALVVTVDTPYLGVRERDVRNEFRLPDGITLAHAMPEGLQTLPHVHGESGLARHAGAVLDPSLSWRDIEWLRSVTRLPLVLKGIVRGDDARRAADHGAAAVLVSNHGGRQLDTTQATIRALPHVVDAAGDRIEILIDGGIRRGTDIVKALALGARAVGVGRPVLWGLALEGEEGVARILEILRFEFDLALALCGCRAAGELTSDLVSPRAG